MRMRPVIVVLGMLVLATWAPFDAAPVLGQEPSVAVDPDHAAKRTKGLALFQAEVRSILKQNCVSCHGEHETAGKLDLVTQEGLLMGGERGPAVVIGRGDKSLLTRVITHQQEPKMPKDGEKLTAEQISAITEWIDLGAPYDEPLIAARNDTIHWTERKVGSAARDFWSFQPLQSSRSPEVVDTHEWGQSPIDQFILAKLREAKLEPNQKLPREPLIRRLSFDLIGLPPTAEEVVEFVEDSRPDAYERLVDRLLANPHYGERWGRRWLDLARFAESHGFEHDYDRTTAFHYRDFVVQALNSGMPYDQFVRWQIAGDEIAPEDRLAMMATGFLAAGVHSTQITKNEVEKHRYDEMDDMLGTIGTSVLGLTVACARCHDHKFDAIPQADYYRLLSTFTKTIRSEVELDFDPVGFQREKSEFELKHAPFERAVRDYEANILPQQFVAWQQTGMTDVVTTTWLLPESINYRSAGDAIFTLQEDASWLVSGPNAANDVWTMTFDTNLQGVRSIRLEALADPSLDRSGPGRASNGNFALSDFVVTVQQKGTPTDSGQPPVPIPLVSAKATFEQNGLPVAAAIDGDPASAWAVDPEFGKGHAAVFIAKEPFGFPEGTRVTVTLKYNTNVHHSIGRPRLSVSTETDPPATVGGALNESIVTLITRPFADLTSEQRTQVLDWFKARDPGWVEVDKRRAEHAALAPKPNLQKVLVASEGLPAVTLNTQADAEFLPETHFLRRGEPNNKESVATQGFLQVLMANPNTPQQFQSTAPAGWRTSYQRRSLTNWLFDREAGAGNLAARVMANRLWQHHLGRGIVATPSDFGTRGEPPTHPELLDWLAQELVRHQWELKPLHRAILSSSVYQQNCDTDEARGSVDRANSTFWHRPRRRLEAEIIRDSILCVSGMLDDRLYGLGKLDETHRRRSLYFMIKRSQLMPSMTVFDAPDGTTPVADRSETTIAPQALLLMNNPLVRESSRKFAARLLTDTQRTDSDTALESIVRLGYATALSRQPTEDELHDSVRFLQQQRQTYPDPAAEAALRQTVVDWCQVLFCLNEFIYLE
ncbi:PSD1 and planctomycete cytochrome C domain-containing protein [Schlesneria sp. DSM 10557]|uniref:PSD1 and planctomycete cytochrome C domain-containing protein n=1 Tax=Schlesneria sp. DSM 10557 TaxID=3044399 RepID=UPI0035A16B20